MSERLINTDSVRSLVWDNPNADLIALARHRYDICLPTAVYCLAKHFDESLRDIDKQYEFLEKLARRSDRGVPNLENTWSVLIMLLDRYSLRVKRCVATEKNLEVAGAPTEGIEFPIQIVTGQLPQIYPPALFVLTDGITSHAVALIDNSSNSVNQFNVEAKKFPTPGLVFEIRQGK